MMSQSMNPDDRIAYEVTIAKSKFDLGAQFPPRPAPFVDREPDIAKMLRYLDPVAAPRGILVFGQGGVGKTTVAIEAAHRSWQRGDYDELLFLTAKMSYWNLGEKSESVTPRRGKHQFASFNGMLRRLGIILGFPESRSTRTRNGEKARLEELRDALTDKRMLLVIDNLDAVSESETEKFEDLVNFYLPQGNKAIITSRCRLPGLERKGLVEIELNLFSESAAYSLLTALSSERNLSVPPRDIARLLAMSQGHPLVMEQIVAIVAEYSVEETMRELENVEHKRLLPFLFDSSISRLTASSRQLLNAIALATFPVTQRFLRTVSGLSPTELQRSIEELDRWSLLIKRDDVYDVHYLLEKFIVALLKRNQRTWEQWKQQVQGVESELWLGG